MFATLKHLFTQRHQPTWFTRNRFAHVDWKDELAHATRRLCDKHGNYAEQGDYVELEFSAHAHHIVLYLPCQAIAQYSSILFALNDLDNQVQAFCERMANSPSPNRTHPHKQQAQSFQVWLINCEEEPPYIHYVADHANDEFIVYLAQQGNTWQAFWDRALQQAVSASSALPADN